MILTPLQSYIERALIGFDSIPEERKKVLLTLQAYVQQKVFEKKRVELLYVCTHNSRRSHFGQIWGKIAAAYYDIPNVNTNSAGTEATAFHPNAIRAVEKTGIQITRSGDEKNPRYSLLYDDTKNPIICYSKTVVETLHAPSSESANESSETLYAAPLREFCAIMTCTEADGNCPFIPGTELRISCPYSDPKAFDGTPEQDQKYTERCLQIATECLFVFSSIKV